MIQQVKIYDLKGSVIREIALPWFFHVPIRKDIIRRAYISSLTARKQPQGRNLLAGKRTTAESWGVGYGIARVPRVKGSRYPKANVAAFAPMTVGGRRAHPPKVDKITHEKINKKERIFAILSAISATANFNTASYRGHLLSAIPQLPLIVSNDLEKISTAKEFKEVAISLGLWNDIERVKKKIKIRAGKGKIRGRKYKIGKGPLIVVSDHIPLIYATKNFPGVEIIRACDLSVMHLAPGGVPGRLTVWTQAAIEVLRKRFFIYENKFLLKLNVFHI